MHQNHDETFQQALFQYLQSNYSFPQPCCSRSSRYSHPRYLVLEYWLSRVFSLSFPNNSPEVFTSVTEPQKAAWNKDLSLVFTSNASISPSNIGKFSSVFIISYVPFDRIFPVRMFLFWFLSQLFKVVRWEGLRKKSTDQRPVTLKSRNFSWLLRVQPFPLNPSNAEVQNHQTLQSSLLCFSFCFLLFRFITFKTY